MMGDWRKKPRENKKISPVWFPSHHPDCFPALRVDRKQAGLSLGGGG